MKKRFLHLLPLFTCLACVSIPDTGREGLVLIPRQQEIAMGEEAYADVLKKEKRSTNVRWNQMLARVGERISAQAPVTDFKWEFTLIQSKEMNAFCLPGGKVAFYEGIMPVLQNEAAMAMVMGHEVAHAVARHGVQRMSQAMIVQGGMMATDELWAKKSENRQTIMAVFGLGATVGAILPFSRSHESEADKLGLKYAAAAGYDPQESVSFWQRFAKMTGAAGSKPPEFLSTHPSDNTRIEQLRELIPEALSVYERSKKFGLGESI